MEFWRLRRQRRCIEISGGATAKHYMVDVQRLEHVFKVDVAQLQQQGVAVESGNGAVGFHKLVVAVHVDVVDMDFLVGGDADA